MKQKNIKSATKQVWGTSPAGTTHAQDYTPGTKQFFEKVLHARFTDEHAFLPEFVEYQIWKHKRVLEIGCGAGYDAYMFCKKGAEYTGIDIAPENIERTKKHLAFYNMHPTIKEMDAEYLEYVHEFDCVYSFGVLHHIPAIEKVLQNIHKALVDDGMLIFTVYNKHSLFYWLSLWLWDYIICAGFLRYSFQERLAKIEYTKSSELPYVKVYTKKELKKLLEGNGFIITHMSVKKLTKEDLPPIQFLSKLYKYIPISWLEFLGQYWGWYLCVKAKKINLKD